MKSNFGMNGNGERWAVLEFVDAPTLSRVDEPTLRKPELSMLAFLPLSTPIDPEVLVGEIF